MSKIEPLKIIEMRREGIGSIEHTSSSLSTSRVNRDEKLLMLKIGSNNRPYLELYGESGVKVRAMQTPDFNSKINPSADRTPKTGKANKVITRAKKYAGKINKALDDARLIHQNQKLAAASEKLPDES